MRLFRKLDSVSIPSEAPNIVNPSQRETGSMVYAGVVLVTTQNMSDRSLGRLM